MILPVTLTQQQIQCCDVAGRSQLPGVAGVFEMALPSTRCQSTPQAGSR